MTAVDRQIDNGSMIPYYENMEYDGIGNILGYSAHREVARHYSFSYGDARFPILPTDIEVTGSQPLRETFTYDHSGSRIQRELDGDNNPATANEISYFIPYGTENLAELDGRGRVRRAYSFATGERTGYKAAGRTVLYLKDHLGSSKMTLDLYASTLQEGLQQRAGDADPYGVTWRESYAATAESEPHQYTGQEREAALDLYYYGARFYDPDLGRFLAVDPAREFANPYSYVGNCPTMLIDLSGRFSERGMTQYQAKLDRDTAQDVMAIVRKAKAEGKSSLLAVGKAYPIQSGAIVSVGFYYLGTLWTPVMMWGVQHPVAISVTEQVVQGGVEAAFDVELPGLGIDEFAEVGAKAVIKIAPDIATKIAREGGKHAGQLKQFLKQTPEQLQKTIKSFNNQIAKHEEWINNPTSKIVDFNELRPEHQRNLIHHWRQDIVRHQELKAIAEDVLGGL